MNLDQIKQSKGKQIYLACPYSSTWDVWRDARFELVTRAAVILIDWGVDVFSPLSHSVPMDSHIQIQQSR